jgi:uncharacterized lipoprotein YmbA
MKRYILWTILLLLSVGCGATSNHFVIAQPTTTPKHHTKSLPTIGVEKITLPEYLQQSKIVIQLSPTQLRYKESDRWAGDMETSLTNELISTIQRSFDHPYVYAYPWNLSKQAGVKVKVTISRFIAYGSSVYLDANWEIYNIQTQKSNSRLFSIKVATSAETSSIVASMSKAFERLSIVIVNEIAKSGKSSL